MDNNRAEEIAITYKQLESLKNGDKLRIINTNNIDNRRGFHDGDIVMFTHYSINTIISQDFIIYFKEAKDGCNCGNLNYFEPVACTCDLWSGCKCGAFQREMELKYAV